MQMFHFGNCLALYFIKGRLRKVFDKGQKYSKFLFRFGLTAKIYFS
jgi:hypothetical protein